MIAGGSRSWNSTFPVRSPWISWLGSGERSQRRHESCQVLHVRELSGGKIAPGDPIADCPWIGVASDEVRPRNFDQSGMETLAGGDDLRPAPLLVPPFERLSGRPPIDDQ